MNRRVFSKSLLTAAAGAVGTQNISGAERKAGLPPICAFEKPLQSLSFDALADEIAKLGFDGIEATVRPKGHVLPERVEEDLPALVDALGRRGLKVTTMATGVNRADDPLGRKVLETAAGLGIKRFRMAYFRYDLSKPVAGQLDDWKPVVRDLAEMCQGLGIQALYQNHAGKKYVGAPVWDLDYLFGDIDPAHLGVAYDIRHATVEGGECWPISYNFIRPRIGMIYVKDFVWKGKRASHVPLGEGRVDPRFFQMLKAEGPLPPISLHVEYFDHLKSKDIPEVLGALQSDFTTLKSWLGGA